MFPAFTNAALLAGLAGVVAPILIHLLMRRRSQRMRFSTVQFFIKKDEQSMRKRKLRNLLLLSLRVLLFALLVLAFARPFLPNSVAVANTARRQQAIILLDASASMQSSSGGSSHWNRAKANAQQLLSKLQPDDRAALVLCSTRSSSVSGFVPPSVLSMKLDDVQPTFGAADLSEGLQQALKIFTTANPAFETTLHLISDLQRPATQNIATVPLPRELSVKIADPGDRFAPNVAVTDLRLDKDGELPAQATITSFSDESYNALPYLLKIDGKDVLSGTVPLTPGSATNLPLAVPALKPGWHSAEFVVLAKDGFSLDDRRFASFVTPEPIRSLLIEPRPAAKAYQEESFFVGAALNPASEREASPSRFTYEKASMDSIPSRLQPQAGKPDVRFVVLPAARAVSAGTAQALKNFVATGGGLLLFLGETVSANTYNTALGELLPAELGRVEPGDETGWHVGKFDNASPIFALFRNAENGNLARHEFTHRFSLQVKAQSVVRAEFNDGKPLLVERKVGEGRVILVNTSADTRWTDWPKHKSFVPWLHSAAFYLAGRNPTEQHETAPVYTSDAEVDFAVVLQAQPLKISMPGGGEVTLQSDDLGVVRDVLLAKPGIYSFKTAAGAELRRIAVNVPTAESDLTFGASAETEQQLARREPAPQTLAAGIFGESPKGRELWRMLLLAALIFLVVEPIVANKTAA